MCVCCCFVAVDGVYLIDTPISFQGFKELSLSHLDTCIVSNMLNSSIALNRVSWDLVNYITDITLKCQELGTACYCFTRDLGLRANVFM